MSGSAVNIRNLKIALAEGSERPYAVDDVSFDLAPGGPSAWTRHVRSRIAAGAGRESVMTLRRGVITVHPFAEA